MNRIKYVFILFCLLHTHLFGQNASSNSPKVGVYYFDGWSGKSPFHLNDNLKKKFPEREPVWGWLTNTREIMERQIDYAANAGITFFNFCWYYNKRSDKKFYDDPKNNALSLYLKARNRNRLSFSLLVANHKGYEIKANDWHNLADYWCRMFLKDGYMTVDGKPFITFFSLEGLIGTFGSPSKVKEALNSLRQEARSKGVPGVSIAICISPNQKRMDLAKACGFDIVTNYNYHKEGFKNEYNEVKDISTMQSAEQRVWRTTEKLSGLQQIPTVTLNWDPRPLDHIRKTVASRYEGYSANSVKQSVISARRWLIANPKRTPKDQVINIFAWNEYGEGGWLTPSKQSGTELLDALKEGIRMKLK